MKMLVADILDRMSICILKLVHGQEDVKDELICFCDEFRIPIELVELIRVNGEIWKLESIIRMGKEDQLSLEDIGKRALAIRAWNKKRVQIKNSISKNRGEFLDRKFDHASQD